MEGARAEDEEEIDPVSLDLYVVVVMMSLSILFLWETGKHCLRICCSRTTTDEARVNMVRDNEDQMRRARRQDAVRRAIERETGEIRLRRSSSQSMGETQLPSEFDVPRTTLDVSVNLNAPQPTTEVPPDSQAVARFMQGLQPAEPSQAQSAPPSKAQPAQPTHFRFSQSSSGASSSMTPGNTVQVNPTTQSDVGTQTEFYQGLTYQQMCDVDLLTTSGRTPSAVHLFPDCHALRNVTSIQRRSFCRYCVTRARQGF